MWKKIDAFFYGMEQKIAKWKRSRTAEYRAGRDAHRDWKHWNQNPHRTGSEKAGLWLEGWMDEENKT